ncbi:hypothetical protein PAXRUDRAFT_145351, partial [Paxillus rubicundulus Ve08.2h10]
TLDDQFQEVMPTKHVISYTHQLFCEATVEWLICTDQPIKTVDHPTFKKMINTASCATNGVIIPNCHATCH